MAKHDGYLLALHHLTFGDDIDLEVSDFAPGDPQLSNHLLIRVQAALIEESRDVAAELTAERQRVVDVIDRVGRMSGFLAHDLNNFLSVIALNAKRLQRSELPDERQRHRLDVIVQTAERCSEFTQGMMTLANQKSDSRLPFALDAAMEEAAALFRSACGTKIALRMTLDAKGAIVNAALNGLANSIVNLLINSRQAMPAGGAITVSTQIVGSAELEIPRATNGCDFVAISIADEGTGRPMVSVVSASSAKLQSSGAPTVGRKWSKRFSPGRNQGARFVSDGPSCQDCAITIQDRCQQNSGLNGMPYYPCK